MVRQSRSNHNPQSALHIPTEVDEDEFFTTEEGMPTVVTHADHEAQVPNEEKQDLKEIDRYWVQKPFAFVVIYQNTRDSEYRYYVIEPALRPEERELISMFKSKLRVELSWDDIPPRAEEEVRIEILRETALKLFRTFNLIDNAAIQGQQDNVVRSMIDRILEGINRTFRFIEKTVDIDIGFEFNTGAGFRDAAPEFRDASHQLNQTQINKLLYYLVRDFIRYERIDPIKNDTNIEDISCSGWNEPVWVYHNTFGNMITNVHFGREDLDEFVTLLAQRAGKGISKREPDIDITLEDQSRAQITYSDEISDKGTNFTIREFRDVPHTPIDLINWETYTLDQMVYLWLAAEYKSSMILAGGTATGKTTTLNAVSLFLPATDRIYSVEDTREIEIPQRNWISETTREAEDEDSRATIDEHRLIKNSFRKRPDYILFGEFRGAEAREFFQVVNSGHCGVATMHAGSVEDIARRLTSDPINVAEPNFSSLDLVITQENITQNGEEVRRMSNITEIQEYDPENNEIVTEVVYHYDAATDSYIYNHNSGILDNIKHINGWSNPELQREINRRKVVLAYLIDNNMNQYAEVASVIQGYMNAPEHILYYISAEILQSRCEEFREMKNIDINVHPSIEAKIDRPTPSTQLRSAARSILEDYRDVYEQYNDLRIEQPTVNATGISPLGEGQISEEFVDGSETTLDEIL